MKVILKGGSSNFLIELFFLENILPILDSEIAIEDSQNRIVVHKKEEGKISQSLDPTAEVIVELSREAIIMAKEGNVNDQAVKNLFGDFFDEALAISKIEELRPFFSVEYYTCSYSESKTK